MGPAVDRLSLTGIMLGTPGLALAIGFDGGSFFWTMIVGQVVADLFDARDPASHVPPFAPIRFARAGATKANPFSLGEKGHAAAPACAAGAQSAI